MSPSDADAREPTARANLSVPLWLLGLFTFSGPLGMHIFVPAMPAAARDLGVGSGTLQLTIGVYILGLAAGQLIYGPLSDKYGRRPALLLGLSLFTLAGAVALAAPNAGVLIVARFFQALGGCSGLVLARAIVRDTSATDDAARRLALMNLLVTAGPAIAPLVGGALADAWGWRAILIGLFALGLANLALAWKRLRETRPAAAALGGGSRGREYFELLTSPYFLGYSIGGGCATTSLYAFIASAPFIFVNQLGLPASSTGLYLGLLVSGIWLGSLLASRLIGRISLRHFAVAANGFSVVGALALLGFVASGHLNVIEIIASMFVFTIGVGASSPAALVLAMSVNRRVTGAASGLYGAIQMAVGAIFTAIAGLGSNPAVSAAVVLVAAGVIAQFSFWIAAKRGVAAVAVGAPAE